MPLSDCSVIIRPVLQKSLGCKQLRTLQSFLPRAHPQVLGQPPSSSSTHLVPRGFFSHGPFQSHEECSSRAHHSWWSERYVRKESSVLWSFAWWEIGPRGEGSVFKGAEERGLLPARTSASQHFPHIRQDITSQLANLMCQWNTKGTYHGLRDHQEPQTTI